MWALVIIGLVLLSAFLAVYGFPGLNSAICQRSAMAGTDIAHGTSRSQRQLSRNRDHAGAEGEGERAGGFEREWASRAGTCIWSRREEKGGWQQEAALRKDEEGLRGRGWRGFKGRVH